MLFRSACRKPVFIRLRLLETDVAELDMTKEMNAAALAKDMRKKGIPGVAVTGLGCGE